MWRFSLFFMLLSAPILGAAQEPASAISSEIAAPNLPYFSAYPEGFPADPDQPEGTRILPPGRPFPSLPTDPRDLKLGLRKTSLGTMEGDIGGYRSIYGWKGKIQNKSTVLHVGIEGNAYFTMRREGSKFPLETSDGLFGLYTEAARDSWFYQLRFTHISAHLADGSPDVLNRRSYSREFFVARVAKQLAWLRPYAGLSLLVHTNPQNLSRLGAQFGFYAIPPLHWKLVHPYFGMDARIHSGPEGETWNFSAGLALRSEMGAPPIRLAAHYLTGNDLRGQFFDRKIKKFSAGLELDF